VSFESAALHRELFEVAQMQRSLSGPRMLRRGEFEISAEIFPVRHLSGDFFCLGDLGETTLLAIGDICGKGLMAAMWFTCMLTLARTYGRAIADPGAALHAINRHLCATTPPAPLTSMILARFDHARGELLYSNAGHPAPVLLKSEGSVRFLSEGGPVLGVVSDARFETGRIILKPNDSLIAFTDGLIECRNEHGEEFGTDRLVCESQKAMCYSPSEMLFSLMGAARDFAGEQAREDDCTLIVMKSKTESA
jgi:sigma-B regulation protein RsbU (phosphoserine phosphatase)